MVALKGKVSTDPAVPREPANVGNGQWASSRVLFGSVHLSRHWLANWNLAYLDHSASCFPQSTRPSPHDLTLDISAIRSGPLPTVTASFLHSVPADSWVRIAGFCGSTEAQLPAASGFDLFKHSGDFCWFPVASNLHFIDFPREYWDLPVNPIVDFVNCPCIYWGC